MVYERMLAWRYIREQKRHSLLTICSIIIAVAMLTMFFTGASCIFNTGRYTIASTMFPHHAVAVVTDEQEAEIAAMDGVKAVGRYTVGEFHQDDPDSPYQYSYILDNIDDSIGEMELTGTQHPIWIDLEFHLLVKGGGANLKFGHPSPESILNEISDMTWCISNWLLMEVDLLTENGRFEIAVLFSLYYVLVIFIAMLLRLVIDTSFEISAKERERQFGVLQSVGATPPQIVRIMTHEGLMLSVVGLPLGLLAGILLSYFCYRVGAYTMIAQFMFTEDFLTPPFRVGTLALIVSAVTGLLWVFFSAYGTGTRVIKMTPVEAINGKQNNIMKVKRHSIFGLLFGWVGKLAARNVRRQKKRFFITVLSLTLSITLVASASFVITAFREAAIADDRGYDLEDFWDYDLRVYITTDDTSPFAYRDGVQALTETGLFTSVTPSLVCSLRVRDPDAAHEKDGSWTDPYKAQGVLFWLNEADYSEFFHDVPPVSYAELCESGKYIFVTPASTVANDLSDEDIAELIESGKYFAETPSLTAKDISEDGGESITAAVLKTRLISEERAREKAEEYIARMREKDPDAAEYSIEEALEMVKHAIGWDAATGEYIRAYAEYYDEEARFPLLCEANGAVTFETYGTDVFFLIAPEAAYEAGGYKFELMEGTDRVSYPSYTLRLHLPEGATLADAETATKEVKARFDNVSVDDHITPRLKAEEMAQTILFICRILMALFALVAAVNMINIISTGILNRRSELGAMCTIGMTNGQLVRLLLTECMQYVVTSGICAALLSMGLIWLTKRMLAAVSLAEYVERIGLSYMRPMPALLIATCCAFLVAAATSLLSLRRLTREPLIESIRRTE